MRLLKLCAPPWSQLWLWGSGLVSHADGGDCSLGDGCRDPAGLDHSQFLYLGPLPDSDRRCRATGPFNRGALRLAADSLGIMDDAGSFGSPEASGNDSFCRAARRSDGGTGWAGRFAAKRGGMGTSLAGDAPES